MPRRVLRIGAVGSAFCALAACASDPPEIVFDSVIPATTEPASSETEATLPPPPLAPIGAATTDRVDEAWRDATGNLAGLRSECGNVNHVANRGDSLVTAVSLRGAWATADGGQTWRELGQGPDSAEVTLRLTSVLSDPEDSDRFWITGVYNGGGVYETVDGGDTFRQLGEIFNVVDMSVAFGDSEPQPMVAVGQDVVAVSKSVDGGETWETISGNLPQQGGRTTGALVIDDETYLVGITDGSVPGVYRSVDSGDTWQRVHAGGVSGVPLRRDSGDLAWLLERGGGLISSVDNGATWSSADGGGISPFATSLVELPDGRLATHSSSNLIMSDDDGGTWRSIGPTLPYEPTGVVYSETDGAFYIWRFDCDPTGDNAVRSGTIMRLDFADA